LAAAEVRRIWLLTVGCIWQWSIVGEIESGRLLTRGIGMGEMMNTNNIFFFFVPKKKRKKKKKRIFLEKTIFRAIPFMEK
jgi:hypothetical protein